MDTQRIILIVLVLLVIGGGYYYYQVSGVTSDTGGSNPIIADLDAKLVDIRPLATVAFDTSLFENSSFRSLKSITATTGPEVLPGRQNPFLSF
ncbi:MAG: hypothetical protein Q8R30_05520 [bacterium]|nr:hypothetical protein [bacterium]